MKPIARDSVDAELVARVAGDTARHFGLPAPPGLRAAWRIDNPYSTVWCLSLHALGWHGRVFVKRMRLSDDHAALRRRQFQTEHDILQRLAGSGVNSADAASIEVLAMYPDLPALATLEAPGRTLRWTYAHHARVFAGRAQREALLKRSQLAGGWLRRFQDATHAGCGAFPVDELLGYCDVRLKRLTTRYPDRFPPAAATRLHDAARRLAATIDDGSVRLSGRHNDFASHNLIAHEAGGIRVLDFQAFDHGPEVFDICNFWYELELLKLDPTYSAALLTRMQQAFIEAHGRIDPSDPAFQLARLRFAINRLLNELSAMSWGSRLSWRRHRCIQANLDWLCSFPARS